MEKYILDRDVPLICVTADSFPNGVMAAHQKLHGLVPADSGRMYYGLSRPEGGGPIVYRAAVEEASDGEAEKLGCERLVLKKGIYISIFIQDFCDNPPSIGMAFQQLISEHGIDPDGICVEMYLTERDVRCMVRLED